MCFVASQGKIGGAPKPGEPPEKNTTLHWAVEHGHYPYLWDAATKNWTVSTTVRNVFTMGSGGPTAKASAKLSSGSVGRLWLS